MTDTRKGYTMRLDVIRYGTRYLGRVVHENNGRFVQVVERSGFTTHEEATQWAMRYSTKWSVNNGR